MKKKKKKPDQVVWSEERGYYANQLSYGSNLSAPAIKLEDVDTWKQKSAKTVNRFLETKFNELREEAKKLVEEYKWNDLIYTQVNYSFQPLIGEIYHLYLKEDKTLFLSLIEPSQWKQSYVGSFRLDSNGKWIKVENGISEL